MFWLVDTSISRTDPMRRGGERAFDDLILALQRSDTPYEIVKQKPMEPKLIPADWDTFQPEEPPEVIPDFDGPVFATGIMSLKLTCAKHGWNPGYIDAPGQTDLIEHWGEHVLNHDAVIGRFDTVEPPASEFFARPVEDTKTFAGTVYAYDPDRPNEGSGRDQWHAWRKQVLANEAAFTTIRGEDQVVLAPLKNIYAEYRLYVVGGQIVTGSRYKLGGRVFYVPEVDPSVLEYARERIREYCPRRAICLDIAHVEGDSPYKIIETNSISSSGFYACDMGLWVNAMNAEFDQ